MRAVSGFDATVSAPKSLSVWWALAGDQRLLDAHDVAVNAVVETLERYGATTRIRSNGARLHPDSEGLTVAAFRQSTSRLDDPQIHTHIVISAKVHVEDGRWFALDARMLKKHQRTLGGLYQSVLRAELTERFGVRFEPIVNGQAEITGVPRELLNVFSKRAAQVDTALAAKLGEFSAREGRDPTRFERAAMEREAAADTRGHKTGEAVPDLRTRRLAEAGTLGITPAGLVDGIRHAAQEREPPQRTTTAEIIDVLSERSSTWHRMDVLRTLTDELRPHPGMDGERWATFLERSTDLVIDHSVNLDPTIAETARVRVSDGRSVWIEPIAAHFTSDAVIAQEERILTWALDNQTAGPEPSTTIRSNRLDVHQLDAAAAVAGHARLVLVVGPAGTGKTTMLAAAVNDLHGQHRDVYAVAPTAKAARVLARETGTKADTVAKLIYEWSQPDRPPRTEWNLPRHTTLIVDEAGMLATNDLDRLTCLADLNQWRLALLGDPRQLQAVGRGGMFHEVCSVGRVDELERIHRFSSPWEAAASLGLRRGDPTALDAYIDYGRIVPGTLDEHLVTITDRWITANRHGQSVAVTTATNDHVDLLNRAIQHRRLDLGELDDNRFAYGANNQELFVSDVIATRRNDRHLRSTDGDVVRNRELWTVTHITDTGDITAQRHDRDDTVILPNSYVAEHVHLGYAATEPGNQSDTRTISANLITPATTGRGFYVTMTRGRDDNTAYVITPEPTIDAARDVLEQVMASDRADTPAVAQRRELANQLPQRPRVPELQPRCQIPDWWNTLRDDAVAEANHAADELQTMEAARATRAETRQHAAEAATTAVTALRPYADVYDRATAEVAEAKHELAAATCNLDDHRLIGRRPAKERLAEATERHQIAQQNLTTAAAEIAPYRNDAARTARRVDELRHDHRLTDLLDDYNYLPERYDTAIRQLEALETWRDWAHGKTIDPDVATQAVDTLDAVDHGPTPQRSKRSPTPSAPTPPNSSDGRNHQPAQSNTTGPTSASTSDATCVQRVATDEERGSPTDPSGAPWCRRGHFRSTPWPPEHDQPGVSRQNPSIPGGIALLSRRAETMDPGRSAWVALKLMHVARDGTAAPFLSSWVPAQCSMVSSWRGRRGRRRSVVDHRRRVGQAES